MIVKRGNFNVYSSFGVYSEREDFSNTSSKERMMLV